MMEWVQTQYPERSVDVILYGHSLGAGVACFAAANNPSSNVNIAGIILETPFTSVAEMLRTLYPQKWLPYHYLSPFLRSSWNIREYLAQISQKNMRPRIMIVQAENDEIVDKKMAPEIRDTATNLNLPVDFFSVNGALHFECMSYQEFSGWVSTFIQDSINRGER